MAAEETKLPPGFVTDRHFKIKHEFFPLSSVFKVPVSWVFPCMDPSLHIII